MKFNLPELFKTSCGVYQIRNNLDNKVYIGSSNNFIKRYREHIRTLVSEKLLPCNKHLKSAIKKYGIENFEFSILEISLSKQEEDLLILEQQHINQYIVDGTIDHSRCYNIRTEASSNRGFKHSEETKELMSIAAAGDKNSMYGRTGKDSPYSLRIIQFDFGGNRINEFFGAEEASKELNITRRNITHCCNLERNSAGGFIFLYEKDIGKLPTVVDNIKKSKTIRLYKQTIVQKDMKGNIVGTYKGSSDAARKTGFSQQSISAACKRKLKYKGFFWEYSF